MKKKNYFYLAALSLAMTFSMGACSDNNDPNPDGGGKDPVNLDYSSENASAWGNYMYNVAMLLNDDATMLYNSWVTDYVDEQGSHGPYATIFKDQTAGAYQSPLSCIEEMIESGMWNIANEVGDAKIKDPYTKYTSGDKEGGLYAVESWYSWHSRDDYTNNIFSIRNTYYGRIDDNDVSKVDGNLSAFNSYKDFDDEGDIAFKNDRFNQPGSRRRNQNADFRFCKGDSGYSTTVPQQHRQRRVRCRNEHLHGTGQPVVK